MKKISKSVLLLGVLALVIAPFCIYLIKSMPSKPSTQTLEQQQKEFAQYAETNQLQNKNLVSSGSSPLCASDSSGESSNPTDCTLSSTYIYKLDGNYRDNGKEIFAYLKSKGFDFKQGDKYQTQTENKLNDTSITDNLSSSEPIIVDLFNTNSNVRVRVNLGDRGRTMPYARDQVLDQLSNDQLIVGLQFFKP